MNKKKPQTSKGLDSLSSLVFSTEPDHNIQENPIEPEFEEINPSSFDLRVSLDKKHRKGKAATVVTGFRDLHIDDLKDLAKMLKLKCGVGGAAKDSQIIIQGNHIIRVMELLKAEGFRTKRSGG